MDARGGAGAPGYVGLDGANGQEPGCTWGQAGRGADGDNGGDGRPGAAGAQVRVELPRDFPGEQIKVWVEGAPAAWQEPVANRGRAASPRAAWSIAPMVARAGAPVLKASLGRQERPVR